MDMTMGAGILIAMASVASPQTPSTPIDRPPAPLRIDAASTAPPGIAITPSNIELTGAGRFDFDPALLNTVPLPRDFSYAQSFPITLWFAGAGGSALRCEPDAAASAALGKAVCDAVMPTARFTFYRGFAQPIEQGFLQFYVYPVAASAPVRITMVPRPAYRNTALHYPPDTTPAADHIADGEGVVESGMAADSYPSIALRDELSGWSLVLLGISSDGRVATCRPLASSGAAVLDNTTCATMTRGGRFRFAPGVKSFEGLRYRPVRVVWAIPQL